MNDIWKALLTTSEQITIKIIDFNMNAANAVIPLSNYTVITISGADAEKFLQGQTTNDVMKPGDNNIWQLSCCCNQKGRIQAVIWLSKYQQQYFAIVESSAVPLLVAELKKFAVFSKVTIDVNPELFILGTVGEVSLQLAKTAFLPMIYAQKPLQGFLLYTKDDLAKIPMDAPFASPSLWQFLNINQGIAEVFKETQEQFTPHQLNLPALNAISFKKGCYRGQEIVARMHYLGKFKQELCKVKITSAIPLVIGAPLVDANGKTLGELVNIVLIDENQYLALAVLTKTEFAEKFPLQGNAVMEVL